MGSVNELYSREEFNVESKWLIDPKLLLVGPKIGEGAHAKVYEIQKPECSNKGGP